MQQPSKGAIPGRLEFVTEHEFGVWIHQPCCRFIEIRGVDIFMNIMNVFYKVFSRY